MEWPYASMRRGRIPADEFAIGAAEYNTIDRPYGTTPEMAEYKKVLPYSGNTFTRNWIVDEKQNPTTGTRYAWVRARVLGGKTNLWGRVSLRMSDLDFKAASHDGFGERLADRYADLSPYYDKRRRLLGISGTRENLPQLPDSIYQRAHRLNCGEMILKRAIAKMGRHLIPGRAGVTTEGVANKYRSRCMGRGRCGRGCDLQAPMHSPTALIFPARDTGKLTIRPNSIVSEVLLETRRRKASGVRVIDSVTRRCFDFAASVVVLAASTTGDDAPAAELQVGQPAERARQLVRARRTLLLRAHHGTQGRGDDAHDARQAQRPTTTAVPQSTYIVRFRNVTDKSPAASFAATASRAAAAAAEYPEPRAHDAGIRRGSRGPCATPSDADRHQRRSARCWRAGEPGLDRSA